MQVQNQTIRGNVSGRINSTTSRIVADALAAGRTLDEGIQEAQAWYDEQNGTNKPDEPQTVPYKPQTSLEGVQEDSGAVNRRYLEAVCRFGFGSYSGLSPDDLLDVACLVQLPCPSVEEWRNRRGV